MSFLTPFMLLGALAAAIPVAIHLFFRSRYRTVPWAAMKFLMTSVEQTSRRLKFQELLLLLLRMTVLAMLAFAFARPISSVVRGEGRGDSVDAVFVFDTSFSMGALDGAKTRIDRAREQALSIIDELPPHSTVQIITCAGDTKTVVGPHLPGNLDQARLLVQNLELTHLTTDLAVGVAEAKDVLARGQAANKELYVFSDMQKTGFEQQAGVLKTTLNAIKEKTVVHFVRSGSRPIKNVAIVGITPQTDVPRPKERIGFGILVRNTGAETVEDLTVSLMVNNDPATLETQRIPPLKSKQTYAVTLTGKFEKAGLHVLTAKVAHDDLDGDNRYDQVIPVRDQVNILVVDGNYHEKEKEAEQSSSYFLAHTLLLRRSELATPKYNVRVMPSRLASPDALKQQDICVLVNCAVQPRTGADALKSDFIDALEPFVQKGRGLVIFSGDNVKPGPYNQVLGKSLLPLPLKSVMKSPGVLPYFFNRSSFGDGPPSYWKFKDDHYYEIFDAVPVWQYIDLDDGPAVKAPVKKEAGDEVKEPSEKKEDNPAQVIVRLNSGRPLAVVKKVGPGEVIFIATAAQQEGLDPQTGLPNWTMFHKLPPYVYFLDVTMAHLMYGQTPTYNLVAGQTFKWYPQDKQDHAYYLVHPDGRKVDRLGVPEKHANRLVVRAADLPRAGIYYLKALPRGGETSEAIDPGEAVKTGTPIAVIPDLRESEDLTSLTDAEIDEQLGFAPIHIVAGETSSASTGADRLNREWTVWALLAVLALVLFEVVLAWWCGKAW